MASLPLAFSVRRHEPVIVSPAEPTPREVKLLSDIDDQETLRFQLPIVMLYPNDPSMQGRDPAKLIREALERALVFYYPFAGRLREGPNRKLMVECTGEGVPFIEADADVRLEQFYDVPMPPVPCLEELVSDIEGSGGLVGCPLLLIQVTRLSCGGFVFAIRFNHTMCDGPGLVQFLNTIGEMARGARAPTSPPVWDRKLLSAREAPQLTRLHLEYEKASDAPHQANAAGNMVHQSFFFGLKEISALRNHLPGHLRTSPVFDILAACVWRSRTIALELDPEDDVRLMCVMTAYGKHRQYLPAGFYGNAFIFTSIESKAGKLCHEPLSYAIELIKKSRFEVTHDYMHSVADLMVLRGRPPVALVGTYNTYLAADVTRARFQEVDFGWGRAVFGAPGTCGTNALPPWVLSYYVRFKNSKGEDRIVVPMGLPRHVMERFVKEIQNVTKGTPKSILVSNL